MTAREGDTIKYQRRPGEWLRPATVREVRDGYLVVVSPAGFAAVRPEQIRDVRGARA